MDSIFETEKPRLSDRELFTKIWTAPRQVFRYLEDYECNKYTSFLLILTGVLSSANQRLGEALQGGHYLDRALPWIAGIALASYLFNYLYAVVLRWTGTWLKGAAGNTRSLLRMLAFAQIPSIICLVPAGFLELYLAGRVRHPDISAFLSNELPDILGVIGSGWTITLEVIGIMELRRLPAGKATLNVFLPFLLILIPAGIIYVLLLF